MAAQLTSKKLTIKDTTVAITIPNNPKAELMYYLDCVATVLMTDKLQRYRNYGEYYYLPDSEIDNLLEIARIFTIIKIIFTNLISKHFLKNILSDLNNF